MRCLPGSRHQARVDLARVRRAILLSTARKSMASINPPDGEPIRSLAYFQSLLAEGRGESLPPPCWRHFDFYLDRWERYWREQSDGAHAEVSPSRLGKGDLAR